MAKEGKAKIYRHARGANVYISARVYDDSKNPLEEGECIAEIVPGRGILIRRKRINEQVR